MMHSQCAFKLFNFDAQTQLCQVVMKLCWTSVFGCSVLRMHVPSYAYNTVHSYVCPNILIMFFLIK